VFTGVDHIAIVVRDIQEALKVYRDALGLEVSEIKEVPDQGVQVAFLPMGETRLELVQPTSEESGVARFLEKRGEGIHHICLKVRDIEAALKQLSKAGLKLIDEKPRIGIHGQKLAFVHPKSLCGVLLELYEEQEGVNYQELGE